MTGPLDELAQLWHTPDPFDYGVKQVHTLQIAAADQYLARRREKIRVLDRRATDAAVTSINRLEDVIPLLFSHTTYKSYPDSFLRDGRWDRLTAWLSTLSTGRIDGIDFEGVVDIDDWLRRLAGADHHVVATSGTSGRTSFLNTTSDDHDALEAGFHRGAVAVAGADDTIERTGFLAMPRGTTSVAQIAVARMAQRFVRAGEVHYLTDEPIRIAQIARMGQLRVAIAEGTALPAEIAAAEQTGKEQAVRGRQALDGFVGRILDRHTDPLFIGGTYGLIWMIVEAARERGLKDGAFHPDTVLFAGGGLKGVRAPDDFLEQIRAFFGLGVAQFEAYGMSELNAPFARCSVARYHAPPTTLFLVLDKAGEELAAVSEDAVQGRLAAVDLTVSGRWGGVISGDRVSMSIAPCPCGRRSPAITEIARYTDLPEGDDKLSCAGTVDAYVRGSIESWV
jgi:hypothetical protein